MSSTETNKKVLLGASFFTLIAAGVGFAVRGAILADWGSEFGFTKTELGTITGGGLVGFGLTIIVFSMIADRIGYKRILVLAFILHVLSAIVTLAATPVYEASGKDATYWCLYIGMFMFALANGMCEAVINPLVATLFPKQKTHYLNILHAGWPGGLIVGSIFAYGFVGGEAAVKQLRWEIPMAMFLVPTLIYGLMVLKEKFPDSEARAAGINFSTMLKEFAAPVLLFLFLIHALVGYVELGTDSWIVNIMDNVIPGKAVLLFIYTSALMFVLRFFAGPIVERINPVGLLFISALMGCTGLYWLGSTSGVTYIIMAATVYGLGKTFLWPTMLGVVGERFPKGGALTMGAIGGVGMLSAGLLGGPGIGYKQDYFASKQLEEKSPETYKRYVSEEKNKFPIIPGFPEISGLDGKKVGTLQDKEANVKKKTENKEEIPEDEQLTESEKKDAPLVAEAGIYGGRMALKWTALVPLMMAVGYLILVIYFRAKGGYQAEELKGHHPEGEEFTGGVEGPVR